MGPIGIFDSGVGGLSVWREIVKVLPQESTIYYADNANCPYGGKSREEIVALADRVTSFLLEKGCSTIVVACNTATAAAIDFLRKKYPVPFVGMEPAVKPAAINSITGVIGVLATQGTFNSRLFQETRSRFASEVKVIIQPGFGLVERVEAGDFSSPLVYDLLHRYIDPMLEAGADYLVLGCTHYPFLIEAISEISNGRLTIVDPAPAVAMQVKRVLELTETQSVSELAYEFYASGFDDTLQGLVAKIGIEQKLPSKSRFFFFSNNMG